MNILTALFRIKFWWYFRLTKQINEMECRIMARQSELTQLLNDAVAQLGKSNAEVKGALENLGTKISELEAVIAQGEATPELTSAVEAVKTAAQAADDLVPDAPVPPSE